MKIWNENAGTENTESINTNETGATKMLTRYVQGIRRYCPKCKRFVTPYLDIENDKDGITVAMYLRCDCGRVIGDGKIV